LIVENPPQEPRIRSDVGPHPDHSDPVHRLRLPQFISIARVDFTLRKVRRAGDDRHAVSGFDPFSTMFEGAAGWRVHFWREIVTQKQNVHSISKTIEP